MRIDYCPKCGKAGLKYSSSERQKLYAPEGYGTAKWCPRCKEWVRPQNRPYIGVKGIG